MIKIHRRHRATTGVGYGKRAKSESMADAKSKKERSPVGDPSAEVWEFSKFEETFQIQKVQKRRSPQVGSELSRPGWVVSNIQSGWNKMD